MTNLFYIYLIIFTFVLANELLYLLFEYLKDKVEEVFGILNKKTDYINSILTIIHISIILTIIVYLII